MFTPDGTRFFVSGQSVNKVFMFDTSDPRNPVQDMSVQLSVGPQPHFITYLPDGRAYVANTNNLQPYGSLSIIHNYMGTPTISGPILTDLEGPMDVVSLPSLGSGDYDFDGDVDTDDLTYFLPCLLEPEAGPQCNGCGVFDFNDDETIDGLDIPLFVEASVGA